MNEDWADYLQRIDLIDRGGIEKGGQDLTIGANCKVFDPSSRGKGVNIVDFKRKRTPSRSRASKREGTRDESKGFEKVVKLHYGMKEKVL